MIKWARGLNIPNNFELEKRVQNILEYFYNNDPDCECHISDVDATGYSGNILSQKLNDTKTLRLPLSGIIKIFHKEGQIIEMNLKIFCKPGTYLINIRDGCNVDVLGDNEELPMAVLGDCISLDASLFETPSSPTGI